MNQIQKFFLAKAAIEKTIPADQTIVHVTSNENQDIGHGGGVVFPATREHAARALAKGSHRIATAQEVSDYDKREEQEAKDAQKTKQMNISPEQMVQMARAMSTSEAPKKGEK